MERSTEYQRPIYMCFIDYGKAFDCVNHPALLNMMEGIGIPEHTVQVGHCTQTKSHNYEQNTMIWKVSENGVFSPRIYSICTLSTS